MHGVTPEVGTRPRTRRSVPMPETLCSHPERHEQRPRRAASIFFPVVGPLLGFSLVLGPGTAALAAPNATPAFEARVNQAQAILEEMGVAYASISSRHYRLLFAGKREFAVQRKVILEATRRNFLGFVRRLHLPINADHEMLLVILLDNERQMQGFYRRASGGEQRLAEWVAGYYDSGHNWSVFYNQRNGKELEQTEQYLNRMAQRLLSIPGGPDTIIQIDLPSGPVDKSKRSLAREMESEWARVIREVARFNTVVTQHEGAHQIAYNTGVQDPNAAYPFWLSEGLACVFEVPPQRKGRRQGAARINGDRLAVFSQLLKEHRNLGIEAMVASGQASPPISIRAAYAESWAMFAFLFNRHADELAEYMQFLVGHPANRVERKGREVAVFRRFFKTPLPELQKRFDAYIVALSQRR